jgi:RNA recognition motif-containing protein
MDHKQYNNTFQNPNQKQTYNDFSGGNPPTVMNQSSNSNNTNHILFVADLPEETSEEDIENFFKNYNFRYTKLNRYHIFQ